MPKRVARKTVSCYYKASFLNSRNHFEFIDPTMKSKIDSPIVFQPILKHILWGGRRLGALLGKNIGSEADYAESWEIADHPNGESLVAWPEHLCGMKIGELVRNYPNEILGEALASKCSQFPLLIKFLDANQTLSLQVHPDDEMARRLVGDNGKNEAWVVLHTEPGSRIYAGLKPGVTAENLAEAMRLQTVSELVHWFEPAPGDCIMIPAGTLHAIGAGIVLVEIQQMSDATFRVDDWGRLGADGKPRQLHFKEALLATDYCRGPVGPWKPETIDSDHPNLTQEKLARCDYFEIDRWRFNGKLQLCDQNTQQFKVVIIISGKVHVSGDFQNDFEAGIGTTILLPASLKNCELLSIGDQKAEILTCQVPV